MFWLSLVACFSTNRSAPAPTDGAVHGRSEQNQVQRQPAFSPALTGLCDASGAVVIGDEVWVVDDEDNIIFVFDSEGAPLREHHFDDFWPGLLHGEADLEGLAVAGDQLFVVGSHDAGKSTTPRPERQVLAVINIKNNTPTPGVIYTDLRSKLMADERYTEIMSSVLSHISKSKDGFSIEGLAVDSEGLLTGGEPGLLVGLRAPVRGESAFIVPVVPKNGQLSLGDPVALNLGGLGVRSLEGDGPWVGVAGPSNSDGPFRFFRFDGKKVQLGPELSGALRPEAIFEVSGTYRALSDDGSLRIGGTKCKKLPRSARRARWVSVRLPDNEKSR